MDLLQFEIFGIKFQEPITCFTNFTLVILCFFAAKRLKEASNSGYHLFWWRLFFLFFGLSNIFAGLSHLFSFYHLIFINQISWLLSGISIFCAEKASIGSLRNQKLFSFFRFIIGAKLIIFITALLIYKSFSVVLINSMTGLIIFVIILHVLLFYRYGFEYSKIIAAGFILGLLTPFTFLMHVSFGKWFNHLDLSHIIMLGSLYVILQGVQMEIPEKEKVKIKAGIQSD